MHKAVVALLHMRYINVDCDWRGQSVSLRHIHFHSRMAHIKRSKFVQHLDEALEEYNAMPVR